MQHIGNFWTSAIRARDRRSTREWSFDRLRLVEPLTKTGPFDTSQSRHFEAPLAALDDDRVREVNVLAPPRSGKTLIADVWVSSVIGRTPGPTRWVFQDDKAASDHAELRTWNIIRANPWLHALLPEDRHKARGQEIIFPSMPLHISGPSINQLQSRGYQNAIADEVWLWKTGRLQELKNRLGDYAKLGTDKLRALSQGGENGSDWDEQCRSGVRHEWGVCCLSCGKRFEPSSWTLKRADGSRWGVRWEKHKTESGLWDIPRVLPTVRFECEHCGHPHVDSPRTKAEWNRMGSYRAEETNKDPKRVTFHWTSFVDMSWAALVEEFLGSVNAWRLGNPTPLIQFFQKRMAEMKSENALTEELSFDLKRTDYEVNAAWPDELVRFMTIDRQDEDVYWWQVRAWAKDGRSRRLAFGKAFGAAELEEIRSKLKVRPNHTLIDSGFRPKGDHGVYAICIRYGWIPIKGYATEGGEERFFYHQTKKGRIQRTYSEPILCDPEMGTSGEGRRQVRRIDFSSPTYNDRLQHLLDDGLWEEPKADESDPMEKQYRKQMAAEWKKRMTVGQLKKERYVWICPSGNNHQRDCAKMQVLLATILGILPDEFVAAATT